MIIGNLMGYLRTCLARWSLRVNVFSQWSHLKRLSPVCTLNKKECLIVGNVLTIRNCSSPHMPDNVFFVCKFFSTVVTLKRPFSCVHTK